MKSEWSHVNLQPDPNLISAGRSGSPSTTNTRENQRRSSGEERLTGSASIRINQSGDLESKKKTPWSSIHAYPTGRTGSRGDTSAVRPRQGCVRASPRGIWADRWLQVDPPDASGLCSVWKACWPLQRGMFLCKLPSAQNRLFTESWM